MKVCQEWGDHSGFDNSPLAMMEPLGLPEAGDSNLEEMMIERLAVIN